MTIIRNLIPDRPAPVLELSRELVFEASPQAAAADGLLALIESAGLRGRGGAGFPAATKLRAVRDAARESGRRPVVVANGEEGEPGSVKDRWLLRNRPDLIVRGLLAAATITGADRGYIYLSDPVAAGTVKQALIDTDPGIPVEIVEVDRAYVAGEESAVVRRIDGGPALPRAKPPRPYESGVGGAPTLVANVETLARIALLPASPNAASSVLVTVSARSGEAVLAEAGPETTLLELARVLDLPGLPTAILMGGLFGGILGASRLVLSLDPAVLAAAGTGLGCGAVRFLYKGECPVAAVGDALDYLAAESSRQCGVCVSGTAALARTLRALRNGEAGADDVANIRRWAGGLPGRGACALVDAAARLGGSLVENFPDLVRAHLGRPCATCTAVSETQAPPGHGAGLRIAVPEDSFR